jgi:pimeloyl-ACP methyl ester carboxylesterase
MSTLFYQRYGDGEHVYVGIPGFGAPHSKSFALMIEQMPEGITFYGIDPPGIGESPDTDDWSWDAVNGLVLDAIREIARKEGKPVTLVGACSGSFHALEATRLEQDHVDRLYLIEPFAFFPWYIVPFVTPGVGPTLLYSIFGSPVGRKAFQTALTMAGLTGGYDTMSSFAKVHWRNLYNYLRIYYEASLRGAKVFVTITVPKRIYSGSKTVGAIKESLDIWREVFDAVDVFILDGVGHQVTQEDPQRIAEMVFDDVIAQEAARMMQDEVREASAE